MDSRNSIACRRNIPNSDRSRSSRGNSSSRADQSQRMFISPGPGMIRQRGRQWSFRLRNWMGGNWYTRQWARCRTGRSTYSELLPKHAPGWTCSLCCRSAGAENQKTWKSWPASRLWWSLRRSLNCSSVRRCASPTAGLNTALECLSNGVPMVAIPITNDQPGVAARIEWTGTGKMVSVSKLSNAKLRTEVQRVLGDQRYRDNAKKLQRAIRSRDAISMAAELIESALRTRRIREVRQV